jgi:hypothetical protein
MNTIPNTPEKKKAPHWMDCNCKCHGDWGGDPDEIGVACPHCKPELFPNYVVVLEDSQK